MGTSFLELYTSLLLVSNRVLIVTVLVTAISLALYTLSFNLRDRVARTSLVLLSALSIVFFCDVMAQIAQPDRASGFWLRLQWLGIALMPPAYLHFSDALLATTGKPSRGRRAWAVRVAYLLGMGCVLLALFSNWVVTDRIDANDSAQWLETGRFFLAFTLLFSIGCSFAVFNIWRAYRRCQTTTARRRMGSLLFASLAFPSGAFPYLLLPGGNLLQSVPALFLQFAVIANATLGILLVVLVYSVSFFGMRQAERVIRSGLFKWTLRGPVAASFVIAAYAFVRFGVRRWGWNGDLWLPVGVVIAAILPQFVINLVRVPLERRLFYGNRSDRAELQRLQLLSERLLTKADVNQYLEALLATACEILRAQNGFISLAQPDHSEVLVWVGQLADFRLQEGELSQSFSTQLEGTLNASGFVHWQEYWILPLRTSAIRREESRMLDARLNKALAFLPEGEIVGFIGVETVQDPHQLQAEERASLQSLTANAARALEDLRLQQQITQALDALLSQVDVLQRVQAASRSAGGQAFSERAELSDSDMVQWVRDALTHYWGGPKLTENPLLRLEVVRQAMQEHDGNAANALREVLRNAIEQIKPSGARKFTTEWLLYNILEMKFVQGRKVREVALRLAVSEADLYRKQKVAIEEVTQQLLLMEQQLAQEK